MGRGFALAAFVCCFLALSVSAQDSNVTAAQGLVTDVSDTFGMIVPVVLSIIGFFLVVWIVKKVRRA